MLIKILYGEEFNQQAEFTENIINTINSGIGIINYIGHGDPETWSAENIIDKNRDINLINISDSK